MLKAVTFSQVVSPFTFINTAILVQHDSTAMSDSGQVTMHSQDLAKEDGDVVLEVLELFEIG